MKADYYYTIEQPALAEFRDRGSKFIGYAFPVLTVEDCRERLAAVRKEHPRATHHCYAYRLGFSGTSFRVMDDGEPSGTAGRPILGQIDSRQATNIMLIVVRYFGGTQLGIPGLINAYKTTASLVLQVAAILPKPILVCYELQFDYTRMNDVMRVIRQFDCSIIRQEAQLFCSLQAGIPRSRLEEALFRLNELRVVDVKPCPTAIS